MKQEEKYLDHLFESAREEEPQISFEEVSETFLTTTSPTLLVSFKEFLFRNISLNSILMMSLGTVVITGLWLSFGFSPTNELQQTTSSFVTKTNIKSSINRKPEVAQEYSLKTPNNTITSTKKEQKENSISKKTLNVSKNKSKREVILQAIPSKTIKLLSSPILSVHPIKPNFSNAYTIKKEVLPASIFKEDLEMNTPSPEKVIPRSETFSPWVSQPRNTGGWQFVKTDRARIYLKTDKVLQKIFDIEFLEKVFEKDEKGQFRPLTMVSNYYVNDYTLLHFKQDQVRVIESLNTPDFDASLPFIEIQKYRVRKRKAILKFRYKDYNISIQLKRSGNNWRYHKVNAKNKTGTKIDVTF